MPVYRWFCQRVDQHLFLLAWKFALTKSGHSHCLWSFGGGKRKNSRCWIDAINNYKCENSLHGDRSTFDDAYVFRQQCDLSAHLFNRCVTRTCHCRRGKYLWLWSRFCRYAHRILHPASHRRKVISDIGGMSAAVVFCPWECLFGV